jgi:hypothetical protein
LREDRVWFSRLPHLNAAHQDDIPSVVILSKAVYIEGRNHHIFAGMDNTSYVSNLYSEAKDPLVLAQSLFLPPQGDPSQAQDDSEGEVLLP